ncbi:MAG: SGNH/GDSL hydrolase family protein [Acidimicrobiales bacterium]
MRRRLGILLLLVGVGAVTAPPVAQADDPLVYVALGDSFTSGPLVPLPTGNPADCGQSTVNYPRLVAEALQVDVFRDISCGGATIDDFYEPQGPLVLGGVNPPQFDALHADVDVVTVGISGNDVGFVGLAFDCARLLGPPFEQPCTPNYTGGGVDRVSERISRVGEELGQALRDLRHRAPNAEVFVVGYPTSLPHNAVACWPYIPILPADMPYLVAKFQEMNAMIAAQAAASGATYVDVYTSSIGHDVCQLPGVAWVNGLVVVPLSAPAHPNELSFRNTARQVTAAIRSLGA